MNHIVRRVVVAFAMAGLPQASFGHPGELAHLATCPPAKKILHDHKKGLPVEPELSRCAFFYQVAKGHGDQDAARVLQLQGSLETLKPR